MASTSKTQRSQQKGEQPRKKCDYCGRWGHNFAECRKYIAAQRREGYKPVVAVQVDFGTDINYGYAEVTITTVKEGIHDTNRVKFHQVSRPRRKPLMKELISKGSLHGHF
ncbi:hypothetical protein ACH5RR_000687 [Cinchona calisaya]|uniref:CCHC-type domain-containing protein n=1 Tax=Cinchona calisaya TaxID=153742 RepID=A0ABD3B1U1_9GENT